MTQDETVSSSGFFSNLWRQKYLILVTAAVTLAATAAWSARFLPPRYRAESTLLIIPPRLLADIAPLDHATAMTLQTLHARVTSRARLQPVVEELNLYPEERASSRIEDVVERMRRSDITFTISREDAVQPEGVRGFTIGFASSDPRAAARGADRLAALFAQEHATSSVMLSNSRLEFLKGQIVEQRRQVIASEDRLNDLRKRGGRVTQADLIEYEVGQAALRGLFEKEHEAGVGLAMTRRQIGEQFVVIKGASTPTEPVSPDRMTVNTAGGVGGVMIGLVLAGVASRRRRAAQGLRSTE